MLIRTSWQSRASHSRIPIALRRLLASLAVSRLLWRALRAASKWTPAVEHFKGSVRKSQWSSRSVATLLWLGLRRAESSDDGRKTRRAVISWWSGCRVVRRSGGFKGIHEEGLSRERSELVEVVVKGDLPLRTSQPHGQEAATRAAGYGSSGHSTDPPPCSSPRAHHLGNHRNHLSLPRLVLRRFEASTQTQ